MATKATKRVTLPPHVSLDPEKQKEFNQTAQKAKKKAVDGTAGPGVIYVAHLPHGFCEQPLRDFFKQFGRIKQLRVSRSKKTGNSKGYAFIQFAHVEVAKIAADTMNNYLMFNKLLKCVYLENPHPELFKNAHRPFNKPRGPVAAIKQRNKPQSDDKMLSNVKKAENKLDKKKKQLAELGIDFSLLIKGIPVKKEEESEEESTSSDDDSENEVQLLQVTKPSLSAKQATPQKSKSGKTPDKLGKGKQDSVAIPEEVEVKEEQESDDEDAMPRLPKRQLKQTPAKSQTPGKSKTPAKSQILAKSITPAKGEMSAKKQTPAKSQLSAKKQISAKKQTQVPRKRKNSVDTVEDVEDESDEGPSPKLARRKLRSTPSKAKAKNLKR